jgi:hypothetical protein
VKKPAAKTVASKAKAPLASAAPATPATPVS